MRSYGEQANFETHCVAEWCRGTLNANRGTAKQQALGQSVRACLVESGQVCDPSETRDRIEGLVRWALEDEYDRDASLTITSLIEKCLRQVNWNQVVDALCPLALAVAEQSTGADAELHGGLDDDE